MQQISNGVNIFLLRPIDYTKRQKIVIQSYTMIEGVKKEEAKKVPTLNGEKKENGFLIEMFKEGKKTTVYLSATAVKGFKEKIS